MSEQVVEGRSPRRIDNRKIGGFVKFFRSAIDTDSNPDDDVAVVKSKDTSIMEDKFQTIAGSTGISDMRKDALIHDLILVVKSAMSKVCRTLLLINSMN